MVPRVTSTRTTFATYARTRMTTPAENHQLIQRYGHATIEHVDPAELAQVRAARGRSNETALHVAYNGPTVRALLAAGLDPNARDERGRTPLLYRHDAEGNRLLLEAGADIHATTPDGYGALSSQVNASFGPPNYEALEVLLAAGARPPTPDEVRRWIQSAFAMVSSTGEQQDALSFEAWLQRF